MKIIVFYYGSQNPPSSFIQRHIDDIGGGYESFMQLSDWTTPMLGNRPLWQANGISRAMRKFRRATGMEREEIHKSTFKRALQKSKAEVVLAEFGFSGAHIMEPCIRLGVPLVVRFHGTDLNRRSLVEKHRSDYQKMFGYAKALVAVSEHDKNRLIELGCDPQKIKIVSYGTFIPPEYPKGTRSSDEYSIISVTRMADKKAPHLMILAFQQFLALGAKGRLHLVGDGPLLSSCKILAKGLGVSECIHFHGGLPHAKVLELMEQAHLYVQHSVIAPDGDCEGMPVAMIEAAAHGLPMVATRHPGICDLIQPGENGFLVEEYDTQDMARCMHRIWLNPDQADEMGRRAYEMAREKFDARKQAQKVKEILLNE